MKRFTLGLLALIVSFVALLAPLPAYAQSTVSDQPVCKEGNASDSKICSASNDIDITGDNGVLIKVVRLVGTITAVASVIVIMVGGFKYITSTGDSARINSAKNTILYALIGLVISVVAPYIIGYALSFIK